MVPSHWWYALVVLAFVAACVTVCRRVARRGLEPLVRDTIEQRSADAASLVVLVHGAWQTVKHMQSVREVVLAARPDADLLQLSYPAHRLSNADPSLIAAQMCECIGKHQERRKYREICLIGYSKGALLVRKAYVYGWGVVDDLSGASGSREPAAWVGAVRRVVLLAGMNRGWSFRKRPAAMPVWRWIVMRVLARTARLLGVGTLMLQTESGAPFVANLRIQWLDLLRALPVGQRPVVVQLLGDRDDIVSTEDNRDVSVARDFIWVPVNNTGHADIVDMNDRVSGAERRGKLAMALGDDAEVERLRRLSPKQEVRDDPDVHTVIFVLHGIRDMAAWTSQFENPLQAAFLAAHPNTTKKLIVHRPSYGFFGMGPFLLWADRQKNVRWFMDEFTEVKARFPNLAQVHFIGHSNGTYVLASALKKYQTLKVNRIAFAGSVVRRDYEWEALGPRIESVRNYVGSSDWVVGWFPKLFELSGFGMLNPDIGSAGFNGFTSGVGNALEMKYVSGAHDAGLREKNIDSIVAFIVNGQSTQSDAYTGTRSTWLELSSRVCWLIWLLLIALIALGGYAALSIVSPMLASTLGDFADVATIAGYVFVIFLILKNV